MKSICNAQLLDSGKNQIPAIIRDWPDELKQMVEFHDQMACRESLFGKGFANKARKGSCALLIWTVGSALGV